MMKFSLIMVSYNNPLLIKQCLDSLYVAAQGHEVEIIVVDNNSGDETIRVLEKESQIKLLKNKTNDGFGKANNAGYKVATGDWIILLNDDTTVPADFFTKAVSFIENNEQYAIMGTLAVSPDGFPQPTFYNKDYYRQLLIPSPSFREFVSALSFRNDTALKKRVLWKNSGAYSFHNAHEVDSLSGVCLFIRRDVPDKLGLFDENYFMYVEDLDFCVKARRNGYRMVFNPDIVITHYIKPIKNKSSISWFRYNKHLQYFFRKNFPWQVNLVAQPILLAKALVKFLLLKLR